MPQSRPNDQLLFALERLGAFLRGAQWHIAHGHKLTPTQADALAWLARRGPARNAAIAAMLAVTPATLSDAVSALVAKGLVRRQPDPADGRARIIALTPAGEKAAAVLHRAPHALGDVLSDLPACDQGALLRLLTRLIRDLQEARAIPAQRMCASCKYFRPNVHSDAARPHHCAFVNAAFGDAELRLDCGEHEAALPEEAVAIWRRFEAA